MCRVVQQYEDVSIKSCDCDAYGAPGSNDLVSTVPKCRTTMLRYPSQQSVVAVVAAAVAVVILVLWLMSTFRCYKP